MMKVWNKVLEILGNLLYVSDPGRCAEIRACPYWLNNREIFYMHSVKKFWLIMLGFNHMSTLVGHFVLSPREREKREEIVKEMKERAWEERGRNESEETEEIKTFPLYPYLLQG